MSNKNVINIKKKPKEILINFFLPNNIGDNDWCQNNYIFTAYIDENIYLLDHLIKINNEYYTIMRFEQNNCLLLEINSSFRIEHFIETKENICLTDLEERVNYINDWIKNGILEVVFTQYKNYLQKRELDNPL